jgi:alginate O-acetyltransferase complex protein AlgI
MLFNSYVFIFLFLPITLFLFFSTAKYSRQAALGFLFLASMIFYEWSFSIKMTFSKLENE